MSAKAIAVRRRRAASPSPPASSRTAGVIRAKVLSKPFHGRDRPLCCTSAQPRPRRRAGGQAMAGDPGGRYYAVLVLPEAWRDDYESGDLGRIQERLREALHAVSAE